MASAPVRPIELFIPAVALVLLCLCAYPDLVVGSPPLSQDNNLHLLRMDEISRIVARGQVSGWTDREGSGLPVGVLYPSADYLPGAALHALLGVPLARAYAWTILGMVVLVTLCTFAAGALRFSLPVGIVAGLLVLQDPGRLWAGGHSFNIDVGVWPSSAGAALALLGIFLWPSGIGEARRGSWVLSALALGGSIYLHPVAAQVMATAFPIWILALLATSDYFRAWKDMTLAALACASGLALSAAWLLPTIMNREFMLFYPMPPMAASKIAHELLTGSMFQGWWSVPLLAVGLCLLLMRRCAAGIFMVLAVPLTLVISTSFGYHAAASSGLVSYQALDAMQLSRIQYLTRGCVFLAQAWAIVAGGRWLFELALVRWAGFSALFDRARLPLYGVACISGCGLALYFHRELSSELSPADRLHLEQALDHATARLLPGERLGLAAGKDDHYLVGPAVFRDVPLYKIGFEPSNMFGNVLTSSDDIALSRAAVSMVVARKPYGKAMGELLATYGDFEVLRRKTLPRAWMEGPGQVTTLTWEDEEIRLQVRDSGPTSRVHLTLGYFPAWRSMQGLPLAPERFGEINLTSLAARDGDLVLRYGQLRGKKSGMWISCLAAIALLIAEIQSMRAAQRRVNRP